jgi:hypothetical protein
MIIELPSIIIDGKELAKNVRARFVHQNDKHQFRCKMIINSGEKDQSLDIVAYDMTMPKIDMSSLTLYTSIHGKEMNQNVLYNISFKIGLIKRSTKIKGTIGEHQVDKTIHDISEIDDILGLFISKT